MVKKTFRNAAISAMAASATVAAVAPAAVSAENDVHFSDVDQNNTHYEGIMALAEQGIIQGDEDGTFRPYVKMKRCGVAEMFVNALDLDVPDYPINYLGPYDDIDTSSDHAEAIAEKVGDSPHSASLVCE